MTERGKFIVLEGLDGAGTTTITRELMARLAEESTPATSTFEPTASPAGMLLRQYLKGDFSPLMSWRAMALLFTADRYDHSTWMEKQLQEGVWVLCDRYRWSTYAYQTATATLEECRGLEGQERLGSMARILGWLEQINDEALVPDMTLMLDIGVEAALKRVDNDRKAPREVYEKAPFLRVVEEVYNRLVDVTAPSKDGHLVVVDASRSIDEVVDECWDDLKSKLL